MNILFLATRAFTLNRGGIERFSIELGKRFIADGNRVIYLSSVNDLTLNEAKNLGVDAPHLYSPDKNHISSTTNLEYLCQVVDEEKIDIILNQQADNRQWIDLCHVVSGRTGVKVVTILHFDPYHYLNIFQASTHEIFSAGLSYQQKIGLWIRNTSLYRLRQKSLFGKVFSSAVNNSDAFVVLSQNARPRLMDMMGGRVDPHKVFVISNPVTVGSQISSKPSKKNQLLFVGRMEFIAKRPDLMLQIWERLYQDFPDWELIVVGNGSYLPTAKQLAAQNKLERISFVGGANSSEFYVHASILCVTSNTEGFSLVTVEASQNYVVPVSFDSFTAVTDVIRHGTTGFIVPAFDIDEYVLRLRQLMSSPSLLNQMAESAHDYVQVFGMDRIAPQWYELFDSILQSSPHHS